MSNKLNISVILPLKSSLVRDFADYFGKAIQSLKNQQVQIDELVIIPTQEESLNTFLKGFDFGDLNVNTYVWEHEPNFCDQMNFGVGKSKNPWISFFEFDDEYSAIWFKNVKKFMESYPKSEGFLPIVVDTDEKGVFKGFTNEATFAANFSQEMGILTNETLNDYSNFQTSGMVLKKQAIQDFGGFKPSIRLTFIYEFLLRLTYNSVNIMTIPRLGYKHTNMREGSIFWNYKNGESVLTDDEVKFWLQTAKKEYFFVDDRSIKYETTNE
jgi:hypothetical protein